MLNIIFMGTPDFARDSLRAIDQAGHNILAVVTSPDKPKGRGLKLAFSPVKEYAMERNFTIYQPEKIRKNQEFLKIVKDLKPDVICVVAYGKILPKEILEMPHLGSINVHGSLLPQYRGAAPIQWAVLNGDKTTGVTTMYMDEGLDTGDIILKKEVMIGDDETTGELWERLSELGGKLLVETLEKIEKKTSPRIKQQGESSYAPMLEKEMATINWETMGSTKIKNLVRGLNPMMGAITSLDTKKLKFWKVQAIGEKEFMEQFPEFQEYQFEFKKVVAGTILYVEDKKGLYIKTIDGVISVLEIQGENAKKMSIHDFLRGNKLEAGQMLCS